MAKVQGPFLSQTASGSVGNALTARRVNGAAVMSMKRVRGTKFPQSRPESVSAIRWWNRGNAFKVSAAWLPVMETTRYVCGANSTTGETVLLRDIIDYIVAQGDAQIGIKSSRSRRGFYVQQSLINLISLELDRAEEFFPQIETAMYNFVLDESIPPPEFYETQPARKYVDAFFGPRDITPYQLWYVWSRIYLDWFAARLPFGFFQGSINLPQVPAPRREIISFFNPFAATKQQGGAAATPRRNSPPPPPLVQTTEDLHSALAARAHRRQSVSDKLGK